MGRNHLRVLQSLQQVSNVIVFDRQTIEFEDERKVSRAQSLEALLAQPLDYVVVALPTSFHAEISIELAKRCIPTLLEKPMAANLVDAERINSAFLASNTFCAVGHVERFNSALQMLKEKLKQGIIGEPIQISTNRTGPFPNRINDVGVGRDLASHDIDLVLWLSESRYMDLAGQLANVREESHEDALIASGKLESGILVSHVVNWLTPLKRRETVILGQNGLLVADSLKSELRFYENGTTGSEWGAIRHFRGVTEGQMTKYAVPTREPLRSEHEAMIDAIRGKNDTNICTLPEALEVMRVLKRLLGS